MASATSPSARSNAGADLVMVLWHERDREQVLDALEDAYRSGELPEARVRQSLRRLLRLKLGNATSPAAGRSQYRRRDRQRFRNAVAE